MTTCAITGKVAYPSPQAAQRVAGCMCRRKTSNTKSLKWARGTLQVYRCRLCTGWHVGHGRG